MCTSAWATTFSKTITGTWEVMVDGTLMHVLWYQNRVGGTPHIHEHLFEVLVLRALNSTNWRSLHEETMKACNIKAGDIQKEVNRHLEMMGRGSEIVEIEEEAAEENTEASSGNCLIIPLMGDWASIRLLNTTSAPNLLFDVGNALANPELILHSLSSIGGSPIGIGMVFLKFDIYDIVLAQNARDIALVLPQIVAEKRPIVNEAVFNTLADWYECPVALCCFNNAQAGESKPLAFAFEPLRPDKIMIYTLDAHDGKPPDPTALVLLDHSIFVGSYLTDAKHCGRISYSDDVSADLQPYLLSHVMGVRVDDKMENGDFVFETADVRAGIFNGLRTLPPHAPSHLPRRGHSVRRPSGTY